MLLTIDYSVSSGQPIQSHLQIVVGGAVMAFLRLLFSSLGEVDLRRKQRAKAN